MVDPLNRNTVIPSLVLNNGIEMPPIGLGTYTLNGWRFALLVRKAVKLGYRHFDLATAYYNETWFGRGLKICMTSRNKLFITTKLSNYEQRQGDVRVALQNSLARIGVKYLDLYLIHWPVPDLFLSSWKQMEQLYREGLVRAIGVCNFHRHHLDALLNVADVVPAVNQFERHPFLSQSDLVSYCKTLGIQVVAYTPIARMNKRLICNETLVTLANQYKKTVPQIILRWNIQQRIVPIPKTSSFTRLKENISIFDFTLSDDELKAVDLLNADFRVRFDPDNCDFNKL